ncbi:MAG: HlyC/CorC family transporter [Aeriscardovia sp.]|nr:HlyC/CorC family transporter [Aeriscardovia sp.]MBO6019503.1 HlyC/CorC family transporter [Aeriscardovia sp.]MBQ1419574.1 HlyC/CorC family transporter [Aeriscardovia sp.]
MSPIHIIFIVVCSFLTVCFVWSSLILAAQEAAVMQITRTAINNFSFNAQTDTNLTEFERSKKLKKLRKVQHLINKRPLTASAASFWRVIMNIFSGVALCLLAVQFIDRLWFGALVGFIGAIFIALFSALIRPVMSSDRPLQIMLRHCGFMTLLVHLVPRGKAFAEKHKEEEGEEELEQIRIEQGKEMVARIAEATNMDASAGEMLKNIVTLSDTLTREIMVPRTDIVCIKKDASIADAIKLFSKTGFGKLPVIGEDIDDLLGVLYLKDVIYATTLGSVSQDAKTLSLVRDPFLVPESKPVDDLFHQMQDRNQHFSVVVDEYGGIAGLVSMKDVIEQIVGDLVDEHDKSQHDAPIKIGQAWSMPARTPISDLEEIFEIDFQEDDVDTVYGLLTKLLGHIPKINEQVVTHGLILYAAAGKSRKVPNIVAEPVVEEEEEDE